MSRILWKLLATTPVLALGVSSGVYAAETNSSLLQLPPEELNSAPTNLTTLPVQPVVNLAQNLPAMRSAPSVSSLEADPLSGGLAPAPTSTQAQTQSAVGTRSRQSIPQVTSVSQLSDVRPTDWAYQALASLVEKYGCIAGYPDGTFRGNRALTRYEMAAALNACLDVVSDRFATKEDLAALQRLAQEFANELALVKGRVDNLEGRISNLEATQFATLTKLNATVIFNTSDILSGQVANPPGTGPGGSNLAGRNIVDNTIVSNRVRLNFDTSFTGSDLLRIRIQSGNVVNYSALSPSGSSGGILNASGLAGTNAARLAYDGTTNGFELHKLFYRFSPVKNLTVIADANAGAYEDNMFTFNPFFQSSDTGALSRFGRFNPIYRIYGSNPAGATINYKFAENKEAGTSADFTLAYLGGGTNTAGFNRSPANPNPPGGLFGDSFSALAQISVRPIKDLALGVTYVRAFGVDPSGGTGTSGYTGAANNPTGSATATGGVGNVTSDNVGFQFTYKVIPQFTLSGWAGYSSVNQSQGSNVGRNASLVNWAITAAAPDLWQKGDVAGLIFGQPPQTISTNYTVNNGVTAFNMYHLEGFYRFQMSRNISVAPGIITIFNPNNNTANAPIVLGVIRTTFQF
ncbi:iron uptake porin [Synechococcus sp. PCC 6312]|uniref:iron uptake porin n=1 Tax=Synechococcus sp. (strain ATCC 27167 / PCC 6312) TaxID=195253 RepID=UPI00029EE97C|nr:iron uptake porin [Synechococcus sp. PCC 6312]AFY60554.1 putative S-layer protein [Synechococcus sp. PCC 6312]